MAFPTSVLIARSAVSLGSALLLVSLCFPLKQTSTDGAFSTMVISVGGDPQSITVADVNSDGSPDIIAANPQAGTVSVLLGDDKGHFTKASGSPFPAGHLPNHIAVADFNNDGHPDLLIANHQAPYVTLLLGDGRGGFRPAPHSPITTEARPHSHGVVVGKFCGPNQPLDAVIDSWGSQEVELLLGDGKGNLRDGPHFAAGPGSDIPMGSADLNGDGVTDIVMPDTAIGRWDSRTVSVLLGDGKCGFKPAPGSPFDAGPVPWEVAIGDVNHDGVSDLVIIPYAPQMKDNRKAAATVLLGDGHGSFHLMAHSPFSLPGCTNPQHVASGGLYGNKHHDFAMTCLDSGAVLLFRGSQDGGLAYTSVVMPEGTRRSGVERGILMADLLKRGRDQILVSDPSAGTVTLLIPK